MKHFILLTELQRKRKGKSHRANRTPEGATITTRQAEHERHCQVQLQCWGEHLTAKTTFSSDAWLSLPSLPPVWWHWASFGSQSLGGACKGRRRTKERLAVSTYFPGSAVVFFPLFSLSRDLKKLTEGGHTVSDITRGTRLNVLISLQTGEHRS